MEGERRELNGFVEAAVRAVQVSQKQFKAARAINAGSRPAGGKGKREGKRDKREPLAGVCLWSWSGLVWSPCGADGAAGVDGKRRRRRGWACGIAWDWIAGCSQDRGCFVSEPTLRNLGAWHCALL